MKTIFFIDGGAGRIITSIPALIKYSKLHENEDWSIIIPGWDYLLWGIPELQDRTYNTDTKGLFDNIIKNCDKIITPEPYRVPQYFRQEISLSEAFDCEINNTVDHDDLCNPILIFNKTEIINAKNLLNEVKENQKQQKTIVIQPFGRSAKLIGNDIVDEESRSMSRKNYFQLIKLLKKNYNLIFFGEQQFYIKEDIFTAKYQCDLRQWAAVIKESDYFIGCDSVGQHMARAVNTRGTVIFGSTFPVNTSYPDYFQIIENSNVKKYSPIRLTGLDTLLSNRVNERCVEFTDAEINDIYGKIVAHIENGK